MIYIIALILYIITFLFDKNVKFTTKYIYSTSDKEKYKTFLPRKVWFVALSGILFLIPLINIIFPIVFFIVQIIDLTFDYNIVLEEGKLKSFVNFLNKDL